MPNNRCQATVDHCREHVTHTLQWNDVSSFFLCSNGAQDCLGLELPEPSGLERGFRYRATTRLALLRADMPAESLQGGDQRIPTTNARPV
jgi:hypothetical protein